MGFEVKVVYYLKYVLILVTMTEFILIYHFQIVIENHSCT
jgi:hypothetical protein